jgi:N-acetylglucosaminyl-diphospho-decaprenol L-rhamnosyltransferase
MADVSVVVVTYSPGATLAKFLDSLAAAGAEPLEVVLADNGSSDGSVEAAAQRPGVQLVATGANLGYGGAANIGVAHTDTEFVVVANPDVVWSPGCLDVLLEAAQRWPQAGSLGPLIYTADGSIYPSARALPSLGRGIGHALCGWWWPSNPWTAAYRLERGAPAEAGVGWLSGSCLLLRRKAFDAVNGFDPAYFMYFEDVDLGDRLGRAGWSNVYVPGADVVHLGGHATERDRDRMTVAHHHSAYRYLSGRYPGPRWAPLRLALKAGLGAREIIARRVAGVAEGAAPQRRVADRGNPSG